jgi:hypothetical protein
LASDLALKIVTEQAKREAAEQALLRELQLKSVRSHAVAARGAAEAALADEQTRREEAEKALAEAQAAKPAVDGLLTCQLCGASGSDHVVVCRSSEPNTVICHACYDKRPQPAKLDLDEVKAKPVSPPVIPFLTATSASVGCIAELPPLRMMLTRPTRGHLPCITFEWADRMADRWTAVPLVDADGNPTAWPNYVVSITGKDGAPSGPPGTTYMR